MADIDKEVQLYAPVKKLFEGYGYTVKAEVNDCDVVALKGDELVVVELKLHFNLKVVYQAMERRSLTDRVYIAIPRPRRYNEKNIRMMRKLLNELGIGLITVGMRGANIAQIIIEPSKKAAKVNRRKKQYLLEEANGRNMDMNIGGSNRKRIITAYTEASVLALCHMEVYDTLNTAKIKQFGYPDKIRNAVRSNAYGWFEKVDRGTYAMSEIGVNALDAQENKELVEYYRKEVYTNV